MNILITGGSGLLGKSLTQFFENKGDTVAWLSRSKNKQQTFYWNVEKFTIDTEAIEWADVIIHLAGASIAGKRWTKAYKQELIASRIQGTNLLNTGIDKAIKKPQQLIAASAIGYYGAYFDDVSLFDETDKPGTDFLAELCVKWEEEILKSTIPTAIIRIGIVLSPDGGALKEMITPIKFGIGSALGSGNQIVSWIHISDLVAIFSFLLENNLEGIFNGVANQPVTNNVLTGEIAKVLKRPLFMPNVPPFVLKIVVGEMAYYVVTGANISNGKLLQKGFKFEYETINRAVNNLINGFS